MKTLSIIQVQILMLKKDLKKQKEKYKGMHQIDIQSGEGNQCRKDMDILEGKITALKWVLK